MPSGNMSVESKRSAAKLRRSCESCRNLKAKCISSENHSKCQRCTKDGHSCLFLEPKPRPKRAKNSRMRVAEMEEKLDELMALVNSKKSTPATLETSPQESLFEIPQTNTSFNLNEVDIEAFTYPFTSSTTDSQVNTYVLQQPFPFLPPFPSVNFDDPFQDVISKGLVQFSQAEEAIHLYQKKTDVFPFVFLSPKITVDTLRREKPFLLLSILCFGTAYDEKLQRRLELELRESMSKRFIVNGEKSMDLLQGLLVYLVWYHFYFDVGKEQLYQLSQMAAALVVDLGINSARDIRLDRALMYKGSGFQIKTSSDELEAQRAYIGCYFVTSSICQGLRKPSSLRYTEYMGTCAQSLSQTAESNSDYLIPYFIRLLRLSEEIDHAFEYSQNSKLPDMNAARLEILVKAFEQQLSQIEATFPPAVWKNNCIKMRFYHLRLFINEVGLHADEPSELELASNTTTIRSWYYSASRSECLMRCLQATKDFLDQYLLLSPEEINDFTMTEYIMVIYALLLLIAFANKTGDSQIINTTQMKQAANLEYYADALSNQALRAISVLPAAGNIYMRYMHLLYQKSKLCHLYPSHINLRGADRARFAFMNIMPTLKAGAHDSFDLADISNPDCEDQWAKMLSHWNTHSLLGQDLSTMDLDSFLA